MAFKFIERDIGIGPKVWAWPKGDEKLFSIFEHVLDIDEWIHLCPSFDVAVQAGGAVGVWPIRLARSFKKVYTFEPQPDNFASLQWNCQDKNVEMTNGALSNVHKTVKIHSSIGERKNYGAGYIVDSPDGVPTYLIDELDLSSCGLICLDIEGAELDALKGAEQTIKAHKPLIVIEDKPLPHMNVFKRSVGDAGKWLQQFGYKNLHKVRWDTIYGV